MFRHRLKVLLMCSLSVLSGMSLPLASLQAAEPDPVPAAQFVRDFRLSQMSSKSQAAVMNQIGEMQLADRSFDTDFARKKAAHDLKKTVEAIAAEGQAERYPKRVVFDVDFLITDAGYSFDDGKLCMLPFFKGFAQIASTIGSSRFALTTSVSLGAYLSPQKFRGVDIEKSRFVMRHFKPLQYCIKMSPEKVEALLGAGKDYKGYKFGAGYEDLSVVSVARGAKVIRGFPGTVVFRVDGDLIVDEIGVAMHIASVTVNLNGETLKLESN